MAAGVVFGLLSLVPIAAQDTTSVKLLTPEWALARQQLRLALMPIPEAARQVRGKYVMELTEPEDLLAKDLSSLAEDSDLIVVAKLRGGKPFLSRDEMSISTEYEAEVLEFINGPGFRPLKPWLIDIVLPGGKIQLKDERIAEVRIRNQKPVAAGETYVFFLQHAGPEQFRPTVERRERESYVPRLGSQGMFQLTGRGVKPRSKEVGEAFKQYVNVPDRDFVQMVQNAVKSPWPWMVAGR